MLFYFDHFMEIWLLPPGINLLFFCLGIFLWALWPSVAKSLLIFSIITLWLLSTPIIAQQLIDKLQYKYPLLSPEKLSTDPEAAIVVLEAGLQLLTPEYGAVTVSEQTLTRLRYAAFLHQKTKASILVSGNDPSHASINQAHVMEFALKEHFNTSTKWKEDSGYNTAKEAMYSTAILKEAGVKKIYLVTHALHMPRSVYAFENKGMVIIPAPTGYIAFEPTLGKISNLLPTMSALTTSTTALKEYLGICWYRIYYRF